MTATLKANYTVVNSEGKYQKMVLMTEIEVTADTDEDSLEEILEALNEVVDQTYGLNAVIKHNWNDTEIFRIADRMSN